MPDDRDHYNTYYADKLWNLLPAVYRAADTDSFNTNGPLREMVNRIGAQAAVLRRSMDRLWEDQSIETCDDWVIAYIADLLATNLVASLDARGQRLDVAKTIYYRRRKGTVAILEEIAADITGWDARVVEFFRRIGRTRHNLDPQIGLSSATSAPDDALALQLAEGLVGTLTHTGIGGWADLRNAYGTSKTQSAFDEFYHTADFRRGRGQVGWHNIPRLGVFLWRLQSFGVAQTTPVPIQNCPDYYVFDPTGREIPLFAASSRAYGDAWVSPAEWQLPTPISGPLWEAQTANLYPNAVGVYRLQGSFYDLVDAQQLHLDPERGRFKTLIPPANDQLHVTYHYGFASAIGAGPFDRRVLGKPPVPKPAPASSAGAGNTLPSVAPTGTLTISDSLTYQAVTAMTGIQQVTVRAENKQRPVIRLPAPAPQVAEWVFSGAAGSTLVLEGLFVSGSDLVLQGTFDSVLLTCCTLDPGTFDEEGKTWAKAVDGRDLLPCHLWVEGEIRQLTIERSITGPIQTRASGEIETLTITESIVQASGTDQAIALSSGLVDLSRSTVLGPAAVHRLEASECILDEVTLVEDAQHGCVRFSTWATGSVLPRQYESVEVRPRAPLFVTRLFGQPGYAQLAGGADAAIVTSAPEATISEGAQDGSEMGAFARENYPIKERSLTIKFEEYMPLGLTPVLIYVT
ncbi:MAG TPA: hypothetical protein VFU32_13980 [Ktedonobacterales bacterium]|nr:hypothetical protein [Ktedonobacterales bacterium]